MSTQPKKLVLVGGGHAHMTTMAQMQTFIERGHSVTLITPSQHHYYSGMGPGMLGGMYTPEEIRFNVQAMAENRGAECILDRVLTVDPENRILSLASGKQVEYDVVSFNTGSGVMDVPVQEGSDTAMPVVSVKPIINLLEARQTLLSPETASGLRHLSVIGGGPGGLEVAGNSRRLFASPEGKKLYPKPPHVTLFAGSKLLKKYPAKVRKHALRSFAQHNVEVVEGPRVKQLEAGGVRLDNGELVKTDFVFTSTGVKPSQIFADSGLPTGTDGELLVNNRLQSVKYPEMFGGGDCIALEDFRMDKVGVHAVRENPILFHNLGLALDGEQDGFQEYHPKNKYLLLFNLGDDTAIIRWKWLLGRSKRWMSLKHSIDRRFMRTFQAMETPGRD